jgi:hypothetical protein
MNYITNIYINDDNIVGRLGNKLFNIASGLGISHKNKDFQYVLPKWKYENFFPNIKTSTETITNINTYNEPCFEYRSIPYLKYGNMNLQGYYQSEKYFKNIEKEIKDYYFKPSQEVIDEVDSVFKHKGEHKITSIHVRRGDYLAQEHLHPACDMEYFNKSMEMLDQITDKFLIFSDDIQWCKENIKGDNILYSENRSDVVDMFMISKCDNHIISNSSYSWWGAWFCDNKNKRVIAPKKWFGKDLPLDTKDLYCEGWEII